LEGAGHRAHQDERGDTMEDEVTREEHLAGLPVWAHEACVSQKEIDTGEGLWNYLV
jgi:hypothetical protein